MSDRAEEIFDYLRHALKRPTMYGTPMLAAGTALGFAALWVSDRKDISLDDAFCRVFDLVPEVCGEMDLPELYKVLLSGSVVPWPSEALRLHAIDVYMQLGKRLMELLQAME